MRIVVEFEIPNDEYAEEGLVSEHALGELFAADLQSMLYDRAGEDGAPPSRNALAGSFHIARIEGFEA